MIGVVHCLRASAVLIGPVVAVAVFLIFRVPWGPFGLLAIGVGGGLATVFLITVFGGAIGIEASKDPDVAEGMMQTFQTFWDACPGYGGAALAVGCLIGFLGERITRRA
jgi:hypothetical protein